ncbi:MAG TPA: aspartate aminotransferase family protein [Candidatus Dormibacteraeota bacterium]|nr:aspartate aminotransferase family protein [Candidatus Dormibacteraeota bacterium]
MSDQTISMDEASRLYELDRTHWLHPQGDLGAPAGTVPQLIFTSGRGATLIDVEGREYIDAMASLWNVNVGYGRDELAEAAAEQMRSLAFSSAYGGFGTTPAIRLAAKLAELAPGDLEVTYFASGGAEANDTAYKVARLYWKVRGQPDKVNIVSRLRDYHGLTYGATSATGLANFWKGFEPLAPGFLHAPAPSVYRYSGDGPAGVAYARALEKVILDAGPDTVAAVVAEPVQGVGGVIVPPHEYFPAVREVCDRHGVLLIADEVITGFGRTGRWFALQHWNVQADLMIFAKGVTSGYLPLSGVMLTHQVHDTLKSLKGPFQHGFTYSGHPTACAVALRNLQIIEDERLVERVAEIGPYLQQRLQHLRSHDIVGDVRGLGLMAGVEFVRDRTSKEPFDASLGVARRVWTAALEMGVIVRPLPGDVIALSPPLVISEHEIDRVVAVLDHVIANVARELGAQV